MLKAKKKKRKGKKEKKVKRKYVDEKETLLYEQEILDNNRELARLRSRNEELEGEAELVKEKFRQLEEDRSDIIAHLKRTLEEKVQESKELSERLEALEELRKEERVAYKKKEEAMENEYRTMENNLSAEVKLAAGKLNSLEDWRLARLSLLQKFEIQEKEMADQEERHKEELYEAEKSSIIGKAKLKKEMEDRLLILAKTLRKATNLRVADTIHRAIHENIILNEEHNKIVKVCRNLQLTSIKHKNTERTLRLHCNLFETESKISLEMVMKQRDAIHKLTNDFQLMMYYYGQVERDNARFAEYSKIADTLMEQNEQMAEKIRLLQKGITKTKNDEEELLLRIREKEEELNMLASILNRARSCIKEALQLEGNISDKDYCASHLTQDLLHCLWEILENESIVHILGHTVSEMDDIKCPYTEGCLGLIEPSKDKEIEKYCMQKQEDSQESAEEVEGEGEEGEGEESTETLEEKPSCLLSEISSIVPSPKESVTDSEL